MKAERDSVNERIWAYLHGEGDAGEREAFERELASDEALRAEVDRARKLDRVLRAAMPALAAQDLDEEALVSQTLAAWEQQGSAADKPQQEEGRFLSPHTFRPLAVGLSSVAAAAALVVVVTLNLRPPRQTSWEAPSFVPLAWRGSGDQAGGRTVDGQTALRCREALMASVSNAAAARGAALPPGLVFSLRVQELRDGVFSVCVRARSFAGRDVGEWDGVYSGVESFLKHADASAGRIVEEVAVRLGGDEGGCP